MSALPVSRHVSIGGLDQRYLQWGHDDAPVVVMLHGLRSYAHTWTAVAEVLCTNYRVIAPDFRGRGESAWDPQRDYFTNRYVADLEEWVDALAMDRFTIVGHSMGGTVGYTYAARHPEQVVSLVVEDIGPGSSTDTAGAARILREVGSTPVRFESLDEVRAYWRRIRPDISSEALASRIRHTVRADGDVAWVWKLDMAGIAEARASGNPAGPVDLWRCVEGLRCPTLVIRGADSDFLPVTTCEEMARRQPLLTWAEISGAGHYVHDDNPGEFLGLLSQFLGDHGARN